MDDVSAVIGQLELRRNAIDRALAALREVGGATVAPAKRRGRPPGSGKGATAANRRSEGQRRRWAKKAAAETSAPTKSAKKRRGLTAAGRKRLSEMMKARWASKNPPKKVARKKVAT